MATERAVSGAGGFGGCRGACSHAANSRISAMWVIYLEIGIALGLAIFIVWFTWPKKKKDQ